MAVCTYAYSVGVRVHACVRVTHLCACDAYGCRHDTCGRAHGCGGRWPTCTQGHSCWAPTAITENNLYSLTRPASQLGENRRDYHTGRKAKSGWQAVPRCPVEEDSCPGTGSVTCSFELGSALLGWPSGLPPRRGQASPSQGPRESLIHP